MYGIGTSKTGHAGGAMKKRLLYPAVLVILVVALALGLSAAAFAGIPGTLTLTPGGPGFMTGLGVVGAATNWSACTSADGDTSYVWSRALPQAPGTPPWDMYSLTDPVVPAGTVVTKVTVYARIRATALSATPPSYSMGVAIGQSGWAAAGLRPIRSTKYDTYIAEAGANPLGGGGPWTWADINDLQAGVILFTPTGSPLDEARCTRVWAVISYETPVITASAGLHGWIDPEGATEVAAGSDQTYTITPAMGYHIEDVVVDGVSALRGSLPPGASTYTFEDVMADHTISVTFAPDWGNTLNRPGLRR